MAVARDERDQQRTHQRQERDQREERQRRSLGDHEQVRDGDDEHSAGDAQRVVLDAAGLDVANAAAGALGEIADPVDRAIDDTDVEPPQRARDPAAEADKDQVVEVVEPPLGERGVVERLDAAGPALDALLFLASPEQAE